MRILDERVQSYLAGLRPDRSGPMADMEALAEREGVPIVHWEAGRFLAVLCRALDPVVLEVGTAIGYSTLHMAEQLAGAGWSPWNATPPVRNRPGSSSPAPAWPTGWSSWRATRSPPSRSWRARSTSSS